MDLAVGCCGFTRSRAEYYRSFRLVELQQTFYKPPREQTARRWREHAPPGFQFTLKAWQLITHPATSPTYRRGGLSIPAGREQRYGYFRPTDEVRSAWQRTAALARILGCRIVLFQCPASFRECPEHVANLRLFFRDLPRGDLLAAWEPRGPWSERTVRELCRELDLLHCVDPLVREPLWGRPLYLRLHGGPGYRHQYSQQELELLKALLAGKQAYVLFNNIARFEDALRFLRILGEEGP